MHIHNGQAIRRNIQFIQHADFHSDVQATEQCCWNCLWSIMTYDSLWCDRELEDVDFRDLCKSWEGEQLPGNA